MADIFTMTAPLVIRLPGGEYRAVAELFPHPEGLIYFDLFWHLGSVSETMHLLKGDINGDGPWRIGEHVFNVLGCHGTDAELATRYQQWNDYLSSNQAAYPPEPLRQAIARKMGANV